MKVFLVRYRGPLALLPALLVLVLLLRSRTTAFAHPEALIALVVASALLVLLAYDARWRAGQRQQYAEPGLLGRMGEPSLTPALLLRALLLLAATTLLLLAAARPKGGLSETALSGEGIDLFICLDVSNSMRARDMGGISRLDLAKQLLGEFIEASAGDRIGVVGFAGSAHVICPFTLDGGTLIAFLEDLDYGSVAKQGTAIGSALRTALKRFDPSSSRGRVILLLTDGEDQGSDPLEAARECRERGVIVHTIGLGTAAGADIPMGMDFWGNPVLKRYHGEEVTSRLDEDTLKAIAETTGGHYYRASSVRHLEDILTAIESLDQTTVQGRRIEIREDIFTWYLLPALMFLAIEPLVRLRRRRYRREGKR